MSSLTEHITANNVANIRAQIAAKNGTQPYRATVAQTYGTLTDYDVFPYPRWWRGIPQYAYPIVAEREAGWRPRHDSCYQAFSIPETTYSPRVCFQAPCSTVYPCIDNPSIAS